MTQIVLGRSHAGWWSRLRGSSLSEAIMRQSDDIGVHILSDRDSSASGAPHWHPPKVRISVAPALATVGAIGCSVLIGLALQSIIKLPNLSMLFMMAVLFCAVNFGRWFGIGAAVISFFAYNFFFIEPIYSFTVAEPHELFALLVFLIVAVLAGGLAGRVRDQAETAKKRAASTQALYEFSRKLSGAREAGRCFMGRHLSSARGLERRRCPAVA